MRHYLSTSGNPEAVQRAYEWIEQELRPVGGVVITSGGYSCHGSVARKCLERSGLLDHTAESILITEDANYSREWPHYPSGIGCLYVSHPYMQRLEQDHEGGLDKIIQDISHRLEDENISLLQIDSKYSWYYPGRSTTIIYGDTDLFTTLFANDVLGNDEQARFFGFEAGPNSSYALRKQFVEDLSKAQGYFPHLPTEGELNRELCQEERDMEQEKVDAVERLAYMISRSYGYNAWKDEARRGDTKWATAFIVNSITYANAYEGFDPSELNDRADAIHHHLLKLVESGGWDFPDRDEGIFDPKFLRSPFGR